MLFKVEGQKHQNALGCFRLLLGSFDLSMKGTFNDRGCYGMTTRAQRCDLKDGLQILTIEHHTKSDLLESTVGSRLLTSLFYHPRTPWVGQLLGPSVRAYR